MSRRNLRLRTQGEFRSRNLPSSGWGSASPTRSLSEEVIASILGLERVIIPGVAIGSGAVGVSGFGVTAGYLWGKDVILAYVPSRPGLRVPAFAYEFAWTYGGRVMVTDRWREEKRKSDVIRVSRRYDLKRVGVEINPGSADFGKTVVGYIIKNAIA